MGTDESFVNKIAGKGKSLNNLFYKNSFLLTIVYLLITIFIIIWTLNKGLVFSDESWYFLHWKQFSQTGTSEWPAYAKLFFPQDLLAIRYITFSLLIFSGVLLSVGLTKFFRLKQVIKVAPITIAGLFIFWSPVQFVPNYITFNMFIFNAGIGFYLLMLSSDRLFSKYVWGIFSGFVFGQLFFIMITNTPYIGVLLISLFLLKEHRKYFFHYCIALVAGIFLAFVFFFVVIKPFNEYLSDMNMAVALLETDRSHGIKFILKWIKETGIYVTRDIIISAFLMYFIYTGIDKAKIIKHLSALVLAGYIVFLLALNLLLDKFHFTTPSPVFILILFLALMIIEKRKWQELVVICVLVLSTFCASLGTDVRFNVRSTLYLAPLIAVIFIYFGQEEFKKINWVLHVLILFALIRFSTDFIFTPGWQGYIIKDQKIELKTIGINVDVKLDKDKIEEIKEIKDLIPPHSEALTNKKASWGYFYLLNLDLQYYYFDFNEIEWRNYLSSGGRNFKELYLLENKSIPFPESVTKDPEISNIDTIPLKTIKNMNLYKVSYR